MRTSYLRTSGSTIRGCRGGIGAELESGSIAEYALEIGSTCNAALSMLALCVHIDEVLEFLASSESSLASLILQSIKEKEKDLGKRLILQRDTSDEIDLDL